ncbi:MAG: flap endonuclease-1 [Thermoproteota archaeon]
MGVQLGSLIVKKVVSLRDLENRLLAVDASSILHQFLSLIRYPDGTPLMDSHGNITSSLVGLFYRSSRLIYEYKIPMVFVFDGRRPEIKFSWLSEEERKRRKERREKNILEWREAVERGDLTKAFSKAVTTGKLDRQVISDAKRLLDLMGVPYVQAPSEAEAQAAHMVKVGSAWASNSGDYDSLLFGTPRMARYISIAGKYRNVWLPSKPEIIELQKFLNMIKITYEQLIDLAILIGTDYNRGIKGIGPKKALHLVRSYDLIENMPSSISEQFKGSLFKIREAFLKPSVTDSYQIERRSMDEKGLVEFLCEERDFSKTKVIKTIEMMRKVHHHDNLSLLKWSSG